jgi:glucose-6-phosphate-specific signal transduction histidine kinase
VVLVGLLLVLAAPWIRRSAAWVRHPPSHDPVVVFSMVLLLVGAAFSIALLTRDWMRGKSDRPLLVADAFVSVAVWLVGWLPLFFAQAPVVQAAFVATLGLAPACIVLVLVAGRRDRQVQPDSHAG